MTNATLRGKPDAGNPHVRFDEGEVASAKPRRGSLLYKKLLLVLAAGFVWVAHSAVPSGHVTEGLTACWDAIDNQGQGTHNPGLLLLVL